MLRKSTTHSGLDNGKLELDRTDRGHVLSMIKHRPGARMRGERDERGFTLIELLVVMILIGILAAIALAVFLNQKDKGNDADAKENVTNVLRVVQACNASNQQRDDFRDCDTSTKLDEHSLPFDQSAGLNEVPAGSCTDPASSDVAAGKVAITQAGPDCFVVVGTSNSGNWFWAMKQPDGTVARGCETHNVNGCPADGDWAG